MYVHRISQERSSRPLEADSYDYYYHYLPYLVLSWFLGSGYVEHAILDRLENDAPSHAVPRWSFFLPLLFCPVFFSSLCCCLFFSFINCLILVPWFTIITFFSLTFWLFTPFLINGYFYEQILDAFPSSFIFSSLFLLSLSFFFTFFSLGGVAVFLKQKKKKRRRRTSLTMQLPKMG